MVSGKRRGLPDSIVGKFGPLAILEMGKTGCGYGDWCDANRPEVAFSAVDGLTSWNHLNR